MLEIKLTRLDLSPEYQFQIGWQSLFLHDTVRYIHQAKWFWSYCFRSATDDCITSILLSKQSQFAHNGALSSWSYFMTTSFRLLKSSLKLLKSDSHFPREFLFIFFNESPLKIMKNAFYFILKALFVLRIFRFLSWHFGHVEKTA